MSRLWAVTAPLHYSNTLAKNTSYALNVNTLPKSTKLSLFSDTKHMSSLRYLELVFLRVLHVVQSLLFYALLAMLEILWATLKDLNDKSEEALLGIEMKKFAIDHSDVTMGGVTH